MRPKKTRWVRTKPSNRCLSPQGVSLGKQNTLKITLDEYEALRLCDLKKIDQETVALQMGVHRSTVSRILSSGRQKLVESLVNLKPIQLEIGKCKIVDG